MAERSTLTQVVQIASEATAGTAETTGFVELSSVGIEPSPSVEIDRFRPAGQKYQAFTALGKESVTASLSGRATYTELIYPLSSCVNTPTSSVVTGGTVAYSHVFESDANDSDTPTTFTVKHGSTGFVDQFTYGLVNELGFNFTRSSVELSGSMMGKSMAVTGQTLDGSATKLPLIPVLPTQVNVYLDSSAASLGSTKLTRVMGAEWSLGNRFNPLYPLDSALGTTFAAIIESEPDLTCSLTMEADAAGMELLTALRAGGRKFLRIEATGATIDAGATAASDKVYRLTIDTAVEIVDTGGFSDNDGVYTIDWSMVGVVDDTWGKAFSIEVINLLSGV